MPPSRRSPARPPTGPTGPTGPDGAATADELAALDAIDRNGTWELGGRAIALKNLDKILFPATATTPAVRKHDLIRYYATTGARLVPFLRDRPVNVQRFPSGIDGNGFWQKELPGHAPSWLRRWEHGGSVSDPTQQYAVVDDVPSLVWLGTQGVLELNGWTSTADHPRQPTWALVDIDPGEQTTWEEVVLLAELYRRALDQLGVVSALKATGQRGLQVWIPVADGYAFEDTRAWVETLSRLVGAVVPELVSWRWHVSDRRGLARLDYTQNARIKTLVSPYSPRPRPGAPVSMPIPWDLLSDPDLRPDRWRIHELCRSVPDVDDPLTPLIGLDQELPSLG